MPAVLLDDRSRPSLRTVIGSLLQSAESASFAVGHVRLGAIDLSALELGNVKSCRLLLDRLDVEMLGDTADIASEGGPMAGNLSRLLDFMESGRLSLRSTGCLCWAPDFSIMHGLPASIAAPSGSVCLVGAHYFSRPVILDGASFTCVLTSRDAIRAADLRFEELWAKAHDVLPVIRDVLCRALGQTADV